MGGYIRPDAGDEARLAVAADGVLEQVCQLGRAVGHVLAALLGQRQHNLRACSSYMTWLNVHRCQHRMDELPFKVMVVMVD